MFESVREVIDAYGYSDVIVLDSFASTTADGSLGTYDDFVLYGLKDKNGDVIAYAVDNYHEGLQNGCFGVREAYIIPDLSEWNSNKRFYKRIASEYKEGIF